MHTARENLKNGE